MEVSEIQTILVGQFTEYSFRVVNDDHSYINYIALVTKYDLRTYTVSFIGLECIELNFEDDYRAAHQYAINCITAARNT